MRYYLDTEFVERPCTIDLLSLALVREDGAELYVVNRDCDRSQANEFVREKVIPNLRHPDASREPGAKTRGVPHLLREEIAKAVREFVGGDLSPKFYGWYADYDWVVFCWLFGPMSCLPAVFPYYCRDLKQTVDEVWDAVGIDLKARVPVPDDRHNALSDARWVRDLHRELLSYASGGLPDGPTS